MPVRRPIEERFWEKVERTPTCWLWTAYVARHGYGELGSGIPGKRMVLAHRASYELFVGPIPEGLTIDHICRVRRCVNPTHLRLLTNADNAHDNGALRRKHCPAGHSYDEANTYYRSMPNGRVHRKCRKCRAEGMARRKAAR